MKKRGKNKKTSDSSKTPSSQISNKTVAILIILTVVLTSVSTISILNLVPDTNQRYLAGNTAQVELYVPETSGTPLKDTTGESPVELN